MSLHRGSFALVAGLGACAPVGPSDAPTTAAGAPLAAEPTEPAEPAPDAPVLDPSGWFVGAPLVDQALGAAVLEGLWADADQTVVAVTIHGYRYAVPPAGHPEGLVMVEWPSGRETPMRDADVPVWPVVHDPDPEGSTIEVVFDALAPDTTEVQLVELDAPRGWIAWSWDAVPARPTVEIEAP